MTVEPGGGGLTVRRETPANDGGLAINGYHLQYKITASGSAWVLLTEDNDAVVHQSAPASIDGFANGTSYIVQVRAVNDVGSGAWSASSAAATPGLPQGVAIEELGSNNESIRVKWIEPGNNGSPITDYDVQYRTGSGDWIDVDISGTATSTTITGLTNGISYDVQVRASNDNGTGPWGETASARPASVPAKVTGVVLTGGYREAMVGWDSPNNGGSTITGYDLHYKKSTEDDSAWTALALGQDDLNDRCAIISGLEDNETYNIRIRASNDSEHDAGNGAGLGDWSNTEDVTLDPASVPALDCLMSDSS